MHNLGGEDLKLEKWVWKETAEVLGVLGIIAGIVFLGFELRQNNDLMVSEARATRASIAQDGWGYVIENPDLIDLLIKDRNGEQLTEAEEFRLNGLWMQNLFLNEFSYFEARDSTNWAGEARNFEAYPSLRNTWQGSSPGSKQAGKDNFDPGFVQFMEENVVNARE